MISPPPSFCHCECLRLFSHRCFITVLIVNKNIFTPLLVVYLGNRPQNKPCSISREGDRASKCPLAHSSLDTRRNSCPTYAWFILISSVDFGQQTVWGGSHQDLQNQRFHTDMPLHAIAFLKQVLWGITGIYFFSEEPCAVKSELSTLNEAISGDSPPMTSSSSSSH